MHYDIEIILICVEMNANNEVIIICFVKNVQLY